jgi:hypothetical protein
MLRLKMKKENIIAGVIALIVIAVVGVFILPGTSEKVAPDGVDVMPDMGFSKCVSEVMQTNPEMTELQAQDNCHTIDAVNKNDALICEKVSEDMRANCLSLFD